MVIKDKGKYKKYNIGVIMYQGHYFHEEGGSTPIPNTPPSCTVSPPSSLPPSSPIPSSTTGTKALRLEYVYSNVFLVVLLRNLHENLIKTALFYDTIHALVLTSRTKKYIFKCHSIENLLNIVQ